MVSHTSDFFDTIAEFARQMIREGNAYMDNTPVEEMRKERGDMVESKCRCVLRMCMCMCMCSFVLSRSPARASSSLLCCTTSACCARR
jgi:hypothetical protein